MTATTQQFAMSRFQAWALRFVALHGQTDCSAGTIALADGRVRIASPGTHLDYATGEVSNLSIISYATTAADVRSILGY